MCQVKDEPIKDWVKLAVNRLEPIILLFFNK